MLIQVELTEHDLTGLILKELQNRLGNIDINPAHVQIQVKSKQNFKAEWEKAAFKAIYVYNS